MLLFRAAAFSALLIGLVGPGPALAQYYPSSPNPRYAPPANRPLPPIAVDEEDAPAYDPPPGYQQPAPGTYGRTRDNEYLPPASQTYLPPPQVAPYPGEPEPSYGTVPGYEPINPPSRPSTYGAAPPSTYGAAPPSTYEAAPPSYGAAPPATYGAAPPSTYEAAPGYESAAPSDPINILRPPGAVGSAAPTGPTGSVNPSQPAIDNRNPGGNNVYASLPPEDRPETGPKKELPPQFRRTLVDYKTKEPAGTIVIDTANTYLYLILGNGKAMRYGIGVGREGFTWSGAERVSRMAEWPDWHPPAEMIERQPYLPRFMAGGEGNPLGARALYLGKTLYRIHGTNQPSTIGSFVSSGCIRLTNEDITDLYQRVQVGTRVVVLPGKPPATANATPIPPQADATQPQQPYNPLAPRR